MLGAPRLQCLVATALALALAAGCGGRNDANPLVDCVADGTCECRHAADCPDGQHCRDGRCVTLSEDAGVALLGFGQRCTEDAACRSGHCLPPGPGNGGLCTEECTPGSACPMSWDCKAATADATRRLCVPRIDRLCQACAADADCNAIGDLCLAAGGAMACGRDCSAEGCPAGYDCAEVRGRDGALRGRQCSPHVGVCECTAVSIGLVRACPRTNQYGTCYGHEQCQASLTWSTCDARVAAPETCDGVDNDCDDLVDAADPKVDISSLPASPGYPGCAKGGGACVGTWSCAPTDGGYGWVCNALAPAVEACNGRDDDCDGRTDNPFLDGDGRYVDVRHCGGCETDCAVAIPDLARDATGAVAPGAAACEVRAGAPACVPKQCAPGFFPYPPELPVTCQRAVSSQCRPCESDGDCFVPTDRCVPVADDPRRACAQGCGRDAPYSGCTGVIGARGCCPERHTCRQVGADPLCVPDDGTCTCIAARVGATRPCFITSPTESCLGLETCAAAVGGFGWSACDTTVTAPEVCDYRDDDCDGQIDEGFVDQHGTGTYDLDEHCGSCEGNCRARWSQTIQHAIGGCVWADAPPHCAVVACTTETVPGGGACQRDVDCGGGRACHALYRQCVRACADASHCGGNPCVDGYCTFPCTTSAGCQLALGPPSECQGGFCRVRYEFHDVDGESTNGCECPAAVDATDEPDVYPVYPQAGWPYVDRDCDGVDGTVATSLFVWAGSQGGEGTRKRPYRTIGEALAVFDPAVHTAILVAAGSYAEQVVLRSGVKLYGGYAPGFGSRDVVTYPTIIEGLEPDFASPTHRRGTVNAEKITTRTVLAGFIVRGYDVTWRPATGPGKSSYAIYVRNATGALMIVNNRVVGGRGGDGAPGAPGGAGQVGGPGSPGLTATECATLSCDGEAQPGGAAGENAACAAAGHPGATTRGGQDPQDYAAGGLDGTGGHNGAYVADPAKPEKCKAICQMPWDGMTGGDALAGPDGQNGAGGAGCADSPAIVDGDFVPGSAGGGQSGGTGSGGGGGGAGGCVPNRTPPDSTCTSLHLKGDLGGTGGGGGAGGCGGQGGQAGGSGGASFGIFVAFAAAPSSRPIVRGNHVAAGVGGFGGPGGTGGQRGQGGTGGANGLSTPETWCAGEGGRGGAGGDGGSGGGGGGGCGGSAYALAGSYLGGAAYQLDNDFGPVPADAAGAPGPGGFSPAGTDCALGPASSCDGAPGVSGEALEYRDFGGGP